MNVLKQNAENVPTDHFKIKTLQIIKTIKLKMEFELAVQRINRYTTRAPSRRLESLK